MIEKHVATLRDSATFPASSGGLLRMARQARGWSQMELALTLGVSQRHVSFVEVGRARPSRSLILEWTTATGASSALRDAALELSGLASGQATAGFRSANASDHAPLQQLLAAEISAPIVLFDPGWNILGANATAEWLAPLVMDRYWDKRDRSLAGVNMIDAVADEDGLLCRAANARHMSVSLQEQITQEAWLNPLLVERADRLRASLSRRLGYTERAGAQDADAAPRRFVFDTALGRLEFFPLQLACDRLSGGGAAMGLRIEQWIPASARTARVLAQRVDIEASDIALTP